MDRFIKQANFNLKLSTEANSRFTFALKKYANIYMSAVEQLYDLNYLPSPSVFDEDMVKRGIIESYDLSLIEYLRGYDGKLNWDKNSILYATYKLQGNTDEEVQEFVHSINLYITAKESFDMKNALEVASQRMRENNTIRPKFKSGEYIKDLTYTKLNSSGCMDFFERTPNTEIISVNIQSSLYDEFLIYLGEVLDRDMTSYLKAHKTGGSGLFITGFTIEQEYEIFESILDREIKCDTELGIAFNNYEAESKSFDIPRTEKEAEKEKTGVFRQVILKDELTKRVSDKRSKLITEFIDKYREKGRIATPYFLTDKYLYFEVSSIYTAQPVSSEYGKFIYDSTENKELPAHNLVEGICGEFLQLRDVKKRNLYYDCKPVKISTIVNKDNTYSKKYRYYVPIQNVYFGGQRDCICNDKYMYKNVPSKIGVVTDIIKVDPQKVFQHFGVSNIEGLYNYFKEHYTGAVKNTICKDYIADLLCAFCMLSLCTQEYIFQHSFYNNLLTKQELLQAQYLAEEIFEKLKQEIDFS